MGDNYHIVEEIRSMMNITNCAIEERETRISNVIVELLQGRQIDSEDKIRLLDFDLVRTTLSDNLVENANIAGQLMNVQVSLLRAYAIRCVATRPDEGVLP